MTATSTFARLAEASFEAREGSELLDGEIFHALFKDDGSIWSNNVKGDVWHRRDPQDPGGFDGPPPLSRSIDTTLTMRPGKGRIVLTERPRPDGASESWRPWTFEMPNEDLGGTLIGYGHTAALAICNAIMHVKSAEHDEEESRP